MSQVIISAINFCIRPVADFDEFARHAGTLLDRCEGSDLVLLPELFTLELFTTEDDWAELPVGEFTRVARYTEEYRQFFSDEARRRNQHIAAGTHLERRRDGYYNVAYLFGPDGERYEHEKTHIFTAESDWSAEVMRVQSRSSTGVHAVRRGPLRRCSSAWCPRVGDGGNLRCC